MCTSSVRKPSFSQTVRRVRTRHTRNHNMRIICAILAPNVSDCFVIVRDECVYPVCLFICYTRTHIYIYACKMTLAKNEMQNTVYRDFTFVFWLRLPITFKTVHYRCRSRSPRVHTNPENTLRSILNTMRRPARSQRPTRIGRLSRRSYPANRGRTKSPKPRNEYVNYLYNGVVLLTRRFHICTIIRFALAIFFLIFWLFFSHRSTFRFSRIDI